MTATANTATAPRMSNNPKMQNSLAQIWAEIHAFESECRGELARYVTTFEKEPDHNLAAYGNAPFAIYYADLAEHFRAAGYVNPEQYASSEGWEIYRRRVGYVARVYLNAQRFGEI